MTDVVSNDNENLTTFLFFEKKNLVSVDEALLINTMVLPYLVDKSISLSTRIPTN
jgi:hypothetical protein